MVAQGISGALGGPAYKDTFSLPHTETASVAKVLKNAGLAEPERRDRHRRLEGQDRGAHLRASDGRTRIDCVVLLRQPGRRHPHAVAVDRLHEERRSHRRRSEAAQHCRRIDHRIWSSITWTSNHYDQRLFKGVFDDLKTLRSSTLQVEFTGNAFQGQGQNTQGLPPFAFGFIAALIILIFVFRTFGATVLPLASAVGALGAGLGLIGILTHAMNVSNITPELTELMVLGVGVDYALFIVTRHRRNLRRGIGVRESIVTSMDTSGRAVLFAAITVCIALLGLLALGVSFFNGMAIGAAVAVSLTMAASLTLLPALLSLFGLKVLPRKQRRAVRAGEFIDLHATRLLGRAGRTPSHDTSSCSVSVAARGHRGARGAVLLDAARSR